MVFVSGVVDGVSCPNADSPPPDVVVVVRGCLRDPCGVRTARIGLPIRRDVDAWESTGTPVFVTAIRHVDITSAEVLVLADVEVVVVVVLVVLVVDGVAM